MFVCLLPTNGHEAIDTAWMNRPSCGVEGMEQDGESHVSCEIPQSKDKQVARKRTGRHFCFINRF